MECKHSYLIYNERIELCNNFKKIYSDKNKSIYEVIRIIDSKPLFLKDHIERIIYSSSLIDFELVINGDIICKSIKELCEANKIDKGNIKIVINAENGDRLLYFIDHKYPSKEEYAYGVATTKVYEERENPNAKIVNNDFKKKIANFLQHKNAYEAILVDNNGFITEGSKSNIFFIKGNTVYTSPVEMVLPGITRKYIVKCCEELGFKLVQDRIQEKQLEYFDGVFLCGTSPKVLPIRQIDNIMYNSSKNKIILQIMKRYNDLIDEYLKNLQEFNNVLF